MSNIFPGTKNTCPTCNQTCPDFEKERCVRLDRTPYDTAMESKSAAISGIVSLRILYYLCADIFRF